MAGTLDTSVLDLKDTQGTSIREAMVQFGLSGKDLDLLTRDPKDLLGYLEVHIEQGPVLESNNLALGVVSAICGIERHEIHFVGESAHAGTCPMELRKDALSAAAHVIAEAESYARQTADLKATVGRLHVEPNVVNAVPSHAAFSVEIRSPTTQREQRLESIFTDTLPSSQKNVHCRSLQKKPTNRSRNLVRMNFNQDCKPR